MIVMNRSNVRVIALFALAAIGAVVSYWISQRTGNFILSFLYAGLGAAAVSLVIAASAYLP